MRLYCSNFSSYFLGAMAQGVAGLITFLVQNPAAALLMAATFLNKVSGRPTGLIRQSLSVCQLLGTDGAVAQTGLS